MTTLQHNTFWINYTYMDFHFGCTCILFNTTWNTLCLYSIQLTLKDTLLWFCGWNVNDTSIISKASVNIVVITIAQAFPLVSSFSANLRKILKVAAIKPEKEKCLFLYVHKNSHSFRWGTFSILKIPTFFLYLHKNILWILIRSTSQRHFLEYPHVFS